MQEKEEALALKKYLMSSYQKALTNQLLIHY
jgi:hypothetical protein